MFTFEFKEKAAKEIDGLPSVARKRILKKLKFFTFQENPLRFATKFKDPRFGDYRALFDVKNHTIIILKVGHRRDIYKD